MICQIVYLGRGPSEAEAGVGEPVVILATNFRQHATL